MGIGCCLRFDGNLLLVVCCVRSGFVRYEISVVDWPWAVGCYAGLCISIEL